MVMRVKQQFASIAAAGALLLGSGACGAVVLAGNPLGAPVGGDAFFVATGVVGAEDFILSTNATVESIAFNAYHIVSPTAFPQPASIDWSIRADAGGLPTGPAVILSGNAPAVGPGGYTTSAPLASDGDSDLIDYIIDIPGPGLVLTAGSYWVTFHVNPVVPCDPNTEQCDPSWSIADSLNPSSAAGSAVSTNDGASWSASASDYVFHIDGTQAPVPATLSLLGLGLALLGARRGVIRIR